MTGGSPKPSRGHTTRLYKAFYMLDGIEVEHPKWAIGSNKADAQAYWEIMYGLKATRLKIR
jgi:hypothetical protein